MSSYFYSRTRYIKETKYVLSVTLEENTNFTELDNSHFDEIINSFGINILNKKFDVHVEMSFVSHSIKDKGFLFIILDNTGRAFSFIYLYDSGFFFRCTFRNPTHMIFSSFKRLNEHEKENSLTALFRLSNKLYFESSLIA